MDTLTVAAGMVLQAAPEVAGPGEAKPFRLGHLTPSGHFTAEVLTEPAGPRFIQIAAADLSAALAHGWLVEAPDSP